MNNFKVIVVGGPSASGKTSLALSLAKKFNTDIISVDSVQFYKGLNIGSAKIKEKEMQGIKHYFIDFLDYKTKYNIKEFKEDFFKFIEVYKRNNKPVILCGGSALYLHCVLYNYELKDFDGFEDIEYLNNKSNDYLLNMLALCDYDSYLNIDKNNRNRIISKLVSIHNGDIPSKKNKYDINKPFFDYKLIFLNGDREILYERIDKRVDQMINEGLEKEISNFYNKDHDIFKYSCFNSIGYKEFSEYFENRISLQDVVANIKKNTRNLAKRQITFFKNKFIYKEINFENIDINDIIEYINS